MPGTHQEELCLILRGSGVRVGQEAKEGWDGQWGKAGEMDMGEI